MTFEELKKIIVDTLGCEEDKVTPEATLMTDLEADSLDLVELHMAKSLMMKSQSFRL